MYEERKERVLCNYDYQQVRDQIDGWTTVTDVVKGVNLQAPRVHEILTEMENMGMIRSDHQHIDEQYVEVFNL